jgi:hypothetical protein
MKDFTCFSVNSQREVERKCAKFSPTRIHYIANTCNSAREFFCSVLPASPVTLQFAFCQTRVKTLILPSTVDGAGRVV